MNSRTGYFPETTIGGNRNKNGSGRLWKHLVEIILHRLRQHRSAVTGSLIFFPKTNQLGKFPEAGLFCGASYTAGFHTFVLVAVDGWAGGRACGVRTDYSRWRRGWLKSIGLKIPAFFVVPVSKHKSALRRWCESQVSRCVIYVLREVA